MKLTDEQRHYLLRNRRQLHAERLATLAATLAAGTLDHNVVMTLEKSAGGHRESYVAAVAQLAVAMAQAIVTAAEREAAVVLTIDDIQTETSRNPFPA